MPTEAVQLALIGLLSTVVIMIGVKMLDLRGVGIKWKQEELTAMRGDMKVWLTERDMQIAQLKVDFANLQTLYTGVLLENERIKTQYTELKRDYEVLQAEHKILLARMEGYDAVAAV